MSHATPRRTPRGPAVSCRLLTGARVIWGVALLLVPRAVIGDLPHRRIDHPAQVVARVLGARHLIEALFTGRRNRGLVDVGVAVDAIHAMTFLGLARLRPDRRRLALTNAVTATAFAAAGATESRKAPDNRDPG